MSTVNNKLNDDDDIFGGKPKLATPTKKLSTPVKKTSLVSSAKKNAEVSKVAKTAVRKQIKDQNKAIKNLVKSPRKAGKIERKKIEIKNSAEMKVLISKLTIQVLHQAIKQKIVTVNPKFKF